MQEKDMPISEIIKTALENVRGIADTGTVTGTPISVAGGTTIIPISKISVGIASGGAEYSGKKQNAAAKNKFGGGGGTGITVNPVGFLIISPAGDVKMLNISDTQSFETGAAEIISAVDGLIDKAPDVVSKIKDLFKKD